MPASAAAMSPEDQAFAAALAEYGERLKDPWWRVCGGELYKIISKGLSVNERDGSAIEAATVVPFTPNELQLEFLRTMHNRNVILKSRQVGYTTLVSILWLDHALFVPNQRCAQIAQDLDTVGNIFRDKIRFAYDRLPDALRRAFPLAKETESMLIFAHNNSSIYVDTTTRGGTPNRVHVSEFGKTSVDRPKAATEIVTGAFPSVPASDCIIVESTAEGQEGEFYNLATAAEARAADPRPLRPVEWKFFFVAWWEHPDYQIDPTGVPISTKDHQYFDEIEAKVVQSGRRPHGFKIGLRQRAWYVEHRTNTFFGNAAYMQREMPSIPAEAWLRSPEGVFYAEQLTVATAERRIRPLPFVPHVPVHTVWDIGSSDGTAVWLVQQLHPEWRVLRFVEGWFKAYSYFIAELDKVADGVPSGIVWGKHLLPHDAKHQRQLQHKVASPEDMLRELRPSWQWEIVPPVDKLEHGIEATRRLFPMLHFNVDDTLEVDPKAEQAPDCRRGIQHLWNYRRRRNERAGGWMDEPLKNTATEAADALRQLAQAIEGGIGNLAGGVRAGQRPSTKGARARVV